MTELLPESHGVESTQGTRTGALACGALRDVTSEARRFGILLPTAITIAPGSTPSRGRKPTMRFAAKQAAPGPSWPTPLERSCARRASAPPGSSCSTSPQRLPWTEKTCSPSASRSAPATRRSPS